MKEEVRGSEREEEEVVKEQGGTRNSGRRRTTSVTTSGSQLTHGFSAGNIHPQIVDFVVSFIHS
jgi:hypothetical protein